jgi:predicted nucleic acid-binding Zn ribbon protein
MHSIQSVATSVLASLVRRQPASAARTAFAWRVAVGPALANATTVELSRTTLVVRARDARWIGEVERGREIVLLRLQQLLGRDAVTSLRFERPTSSQRAQKRKGDRSNA